MAIWGSRRSNTPGHGARDRILIGRPGLIANERVAHDLRLLDGGLGADRVRESVAAAAACGGTRIARAAAALSL
jgi:hypothetical protein